VHFNTVVVAKYRCYMFVSFKDHRNYPLTIPRVEKVISGSEGEASRMGAWDKITDLCSSGPEKEKVLQDMHALLHSDMDKSTGKIHLGPIEAFSRLQDIAGSGQKNLFHIDINKVNGEVKLLFDGNVIHTSSAEDILKQAGLNDVVDRDQYADALDAFCGILYPKLRCNLPGRGLDLGPISAGKRLQEALGPSHNVEIRINRGKVSVDLDGKKIKTLSSGEVLEQIHFDGNRLVDNLGKVLQGISGISMKVEFNAEKFADLTDEALNSDRAREFKDILLRLGVGSTEPEIDAAVTKNFESTNAVGRVGLHGEAASNVTNLYMAMIPMQAEHQAAHGLDESTVDFAEISAPSRRCPKRGQDHQKTVSAMEALRRDEVWHMICLSHMT